LIHGKSAMLMKRPKTQGISPFFIVSNVGQTIAFYCDKLGFETRFQEPDRDPFFAIIGRDGAQLFVKSDKDASPLPNPKRHPCMRWDAYVHAPDPDALAAEFADHGAAFSAPLKEHTTVCAASRFAILTATSCSSGDQGSRTGFTSTEFPAKIALAHQTSPEEPP
jgi:catechol 2,3-dioxygenase-like lactoylglutathione lyase family enzyme